MYTCIRAVTCMVVKKKQKLNGFRRCNCTFFCTNQATKCVAAYTELVKNIKWIYTVEQCSTPVKGVEHLILL